MGCGAEVLHDVWGVGSGETGRNTMVIKEHLGKTDHK